ncbi:MAG: hypothetical protein JWO46_2800, partial [Nocardioidaceae bacterium]|nr:hypothetical protein [Nocardioidaceae bacterium]
VFLQPGSVERNPESSATKAATVAAPVRLEIVDLLDVRRGRRGEEGDEPTVDRRGVAGTLKVHLDNLIADRPLTTVKDLTSVSRAVDLLQKHLAWLCEQDYAADLYDDIRLLHRQLSDATGDYRRPAVAVCTVADEDGNNCGGSIQANQYGGAYCSRCHTTWKPDQLRHLGLALAISQEA